MSQRTCAPYGSWPSIFTSDLVVVACGEQLELQVDQEKVYWLDSRPSEKGRSVVVSLQDDGEMSDVTIAHHNVRTLVHEYGGGAYCVSEGIVYYVNLEDACIYQQRVGSIDALPLTKADEGFRFADLTIDVQRNRILCVREEHSVTSGTVNNTIVGVSFSTNNDASLQEGTVLCHGCDFYSSPRVSSDGKYVCWISWNLPHMPWESSQLWLATIEDDGSFTSPVLVAGTISSSPSSSSITTESIFQPEFCAVDGWLYFVSDRSGWGNLYRYRFSHDDRTTSVATNQTGTEDDGMVSPTNTEHMNGRIEEVFVREGCECAEPQWDFGYTTYAFTNHNVICTYLQQGIQHMVLIHLQSLSIQEIEVYPYIGIHYLKACSSFCVFVGDTSTGNPDIVQMFLPDLKEENTEATSPLLSPRFVILGGNHRSSSPPSSSSSSGPPISPSTVVDPSYISLPQPISFPSEGGAIAHGYYYPPHNPQYQGMSGEMPPLLMHCHGGPTSAKRPGFSGHTQYWTSRGYAVFDINYGGSSGYGRAYRERLQGQWGVVDVDDCVYAAQYLVQQGLADPHRLLINGGSAVFAAGASYYGVSDLAQLCMDTHKFESQYLTGLIGGTYPEKEDLYRQRSPLYASHQVTCPIVFFQGEEDAIVPPNQAETMLQALREKQLPLAYVLFPGERHGFRQANHLKACLEGELYFYSTVLKIPMASEERIRFTNHPPIVIENVSS